MTYKEKKSLYESIMKEVAKIVKRNLNESEYSNNIVELMVRDCRQMFITVLQFGNQKILKN